MFKFLTFVLFVFAIPAMALDVASHQTLMLNGVETTQIKFQIPAAQVKAVKYGSQAYGEIIIPGVQMLSHPGFPKLPFYSLVVAAARQNIRVQYQLGPADVYKTDRLAPCPPEKMRCAAPSAPFVDRVNDYAKSQAFYHIDYLGDYRGIPLHRVTLLPHRYDLNTGTLTMYSRATYSLQLNGGTANSNMVFKSFLRGDNYDYLVITPAAFKNALQPWIEFKSQTQGLRFKVAELTASPTAEALRQLVHGEYAANKFAYALIVGSQQLIPNFALPTTSTSQTPTDLPFYTMGGKDDFIPDVLGGRLVATTEADVKNQLKKWMDYEKGLGQGWKQAVGIASNEGQNPSDEQYVRSMETLMGTKLGAKFAHFAQNDSSSNPKNFNEVLGKGAMWSVYLGHGSGTSWPSFNRAYYASDVKGMANASVVKPVWIDVACQNGKLAKGAAGERLSNEVDGQGMPIGTTAYFGGTVNISWHPPAILATGITMKMVEEANPVLGSVIQMGQSYLASKISDPEEIKSNQIWYHLQGDPSLHLKF